MNETITFPVHGMTCASCAAKITRALRAVDGVLGARVDLGEDSAQVVYDPAVTTADALADAVSRTGYEAEMSRASVGSADPAKAPRVSSLPVDPRWLIAGVGVLALLVVVAASGVPLASFAQFLGMAPCLLMLVFMDHGKGHSH